jgi:hypothetical protein
VDPVLQAMKPDKRVQFPQKEAPTDETLARAVIDFADALAKGDSTKFGSMLTSGTRPFLDQLTGDGSWEEATSKIEAVRVITLTDLDPPAPPSAEQTFAMLYYAVQEPSGAYLMGWSARKDGGTWKFTMAPSGSMVKPRASDFDVGGVLDAPAPTPTPASTEPPKDPKNTITDTPSGGDGGAPKAPGDGPKKVPTPHGPVTIPGSG